MTRAFTHTLAFAIAALLALPALAGAQEAGGQPAPSGATAGALPPDPGFTISSRRAVYRGGALRISGRVERGGGRVVRIERQDAGVWLPVTAVEADRRGAFATAWTPDRGGRHVLRAVLEPRQASAASAPRASAERAVIVYDRALATWYGPGFYGNRTACGQTLTERTQGVAHRELPCGTLVALYYRGRRANVRVIDRGPYAHGADWDLTGATARRLGFAATSEIGAVALSR